MKIIFDSSIRKIKNFMGGLEYIDHLEITGIVTGPQIVGREKRYANSFVLPMKKHEAYEMKKRFILDLLHVIMEKEGSEIEQIDLFL